MFIIKEIQTNHEGEATFPQDIVAATRPEIESVFYQKCAVASVSTVAIHTIMVFNEEGRVFTDLTRCFKHFPEPEE